MPRFAAELARLEHLAPAPVYAPAEEVEHGDAVRRLGPGLEREDDGRARAGLGTPA